ncbi:MAG: HAD family hydrolase [Sulfurimonas sp.]|nr:HAD family hydrolase [Sulfurimonas sp.]
MIILFDLDGTLIDSTEAILESFHHSFDVHKYPKQNDEEIKALIGYPLDIMYENLGVGRDLICDFVATYKEHYRDISTQKTILLKNAREAVLLAKEFAVLGIVTTKTGRYSRVLMEHFGLMEHFEVLIGREDVENPKPHEEPILKALEKLDTQNREIWMIGDTKLDLIAATNANVNSIAVLSGYDDLETLKKFTNVILNDALEAALYLQNRKKQHTFLTS